MKEVQFKDLKIDDIFTLNGLQYKRVADVRVSCCRVLNAESIENPKEKIPVKPLTVVQINDQL